MPLVVEQLNICDVCRLLDGDTSLKARFYCSLCDSWLCDADKDHWFRRARAAVKRKLEVSFKGDPQYRTQTEFDMLAGL